VIATPTNGAIPYVDNFPDACQPVITPPKRRPGEDSPEVKAQNLAKLPERPDVIWSDRTDLGLYLPEGWELVIAELRKTVPCPKYRQKSIPGPIPTPRQRTRKVLGAMDVSRQEEKLLEEYEYGDSSKQAPWVIEQQKTFKTGEGPLENVGIGPGKIVLFGAPPKFGKTSFVMQLGVDAVRFADLILFVANGEMSPANLMNRQVARLSGVPIERITQGNLPAELERRVKEAKLELSDPGPSEISVAAESSDGMFESSIQFCKPPWNTHNLACQVGQVERFSDLGPEQTIVIVDYVQLFAAINRAKIGLWRRLRQEKKKSLPPPLIHDLGCVMAELRRIARAGVAVVVVSAMSRSSYENAQIGGFRGSSELEYGCDDAFVLEKDDERPGVINLRHVASRNSETMDRILRFEGALHRFVPLEK